MNRQQFNPEVLKIPEVVTLCGSTRFKDAFIEANFKLTMAGVVVLSAGSDCRAESRATRSAVDRGRRTGG